MFFFLIQWVLFQFGGLIPLTKCTTIELTSTIIYGILVVMIFERMEKKKWKIGEKMGGRGVWLEGAGERKMVGPTILSPGPPKLNLPKSGS